MKPPGYAVAEVNLGALAGNLSSLRALTPKGTSIMAVIKADAYGHGATIVAPRLEASGADSFGVATISEAFELKEAGITKPVFVLSGFLEKDSGEIISGGFIPVVFEKGQIKALDRECSRLNKTCKVHLKIDTGMGRLGILEKELDDFLGEIKSASHLILDGIMTHLSSAEDPSEESVEFTRSQIGRFFQACIAAGKTGLRPKFFHVANSAGIIFHPETKANLVRPGLALYGIYPHERAKKKLKLKPVMRVTTKILRVREFPPGTPLSYGRRYTTKRRSNIATLAIGYADGYSRLLSNRGEVLVGGKRAAIRGIVTMDMILADVTGIPDVSPGTEAVIMGRQGDEEITAYEIASRICPEGHIGSITYEVLCSFGRRVKRIPVDE